MQSNVGVERKFDAYPDKTISDQGIDVSSKYQYDDLKLRLRVKQLESEVEELKHGKDMVNR